MTAMGKATEKDLEELSKTVLREHFQLAGEGGEEGTKSELGQSVSTDA